MHFKSVGPSMEALCCIFSQSAPWRLCTALSFRRPRRGGFVLRFPVGPSVEALYCIFSQSAPPWRLCTAFQVSQPLRGGFVLHFKSVGPSVEASYCIFSQSAPPWRLCAAFSSQSAPPWRFCAIFFISRPLRGGFVLQFLSVGLSVEQRCQYPSLSSA